MIMPCLIDKSMVAPCGVNCLVCYVHLKKKKPCPGCMSKDVTDKPQRCCNCQIKACSDSRGISHCFMCSDFPCKRIQSLDKSYKTRYNTSIVENGNSILNDGFEVFLANEKLRWSCSKCGGVVSVHDGICSECGFNFRDADLASLP